MKLPYVASHSSHSSYIIYNISLYISNVDDELSYAFQILAGSEPRLSQSPSGFPRCQLSRMTHLEGWAVNKYDSTTQRLDYSGNIGVVSAMYSNHRTSADDSCRTFNQTTNDKLTDTSCLWEDWPKVPNQHALPDAGHPLTGKAVPTNQNPALTAMLQRLCYHDSIVIF